MKKFFISGIWFFWRLMGSLCRRIRKGLFLLEGCHTAVDIASIHWPPWGRSDLASQSNKSALPTTPHRFTEVLMKSLILKLNSVCLCKSRGRLEYVRLYLSGHPKTNSLDCELMKWCRFVYTWMCRYMRPTLSSIKAAWWAHILRVWLRGYWRIKKWC